MKNSLIDRIIHTVVYKGKRIEKLFIILVVASIICYPFVGINYDLSKYLPDFAESKQALDIMEEEFGYPGMARIMVEDVSLYEAKAIREQISNVEGVSMVVGVDTLSDVYLSHTYIDDEDIDTFYKDNCAIMEVVFEDENADQSTHEALNEIYKIVGERGRFAGPAVSSKSLQETIKKEVASALAISIVIICVILTVTTSSWFEPFLFIFIMAIAIIINMGTNLMFGSISFFTFSTAAILQLAVSMDYSIFLLDTFTHNKLNGMEIHEALSHAIKESSSSILASGATTIVGFITMALMRFHLGKDVGFVLTKGIIISLATVLLLMPALILRFNDKIEKYAHKPFLPSFDKFSDKMYRIRRIVLVVVICITIPAYVGQGMNNFLYGDDALGSGEGTVVYEDNKVINEKFGKSNVLIGIVPNGSIVRERELTEELDDLGFVNYALSLSGSLPQGIPQDFLPANIVKELRTDKYARLLISLDSDQESDYAFKCSDKVQEIVSKYYPEDSYVIGLTPTTVDIKNILTTDYNKVNTISTVGVALVVLLTFSSFVVPLVVLIPIQVSIFVNMALPYVVGDSMLYIGYIIVNCIQLGATIDYSILVTNNYIKARKTMERQQAAKYTISKSAISVLTSGSILTVVGYGLYFTSTIEGISQIGHLVGRGALLSVVLVLSLLPALLSAFDSVIQKQQSQPSKRKFIRKKLAKNNGGKTDEQ